MTTAIPLTLFAGAARLTGIGFVWLARAVFSADILMNAKRTNRGGKLMSWGRVLR